MLNTQPLLQKFLIYLKANHLHFEQTGNSDMDSTGTVFQGILTHLTEVG